MGHLYDGGSTPIDLLKETHDLITLLAVQVACRLISEEELGLPYNGTGNAYQLLLATTELLREEVLLGNDLKAVEDFCHDAFALLALHASVDEWRFDVFVNGEFVDEVVGLEDKADVLLVQLAALALIEGMYRLIEEVIGPGIGFVQHADDIEQRRLAGAGRPHDRDKLTLIDFQIDALEYEGPREATFVIAVDIL